MTEAATAVVRTPSEATVAERERLAALEALAAQLTDRRLHLLEQAERLARRGKSGERVKRRRLRNVTRPDSACKNAKRKSSRANTLWPRPKLTAAAAQKAWHNCRPNWKAGKLG